MKLLILPLLFLGFAQAELVCTTEITTKTDVSPADFLFIIDASGSMASKIAGVKSGLKTFITNMAQAGPKSRYAVVAFGGAPDSKPSLLLPFTPSSDLVVSIINSIKVGGSGSGQEASFEAMRAALPGPNNVAQGLIARCPKSIKPSDCQLVWNTYSTKIYVHATDEDSDLPTTSSYRVDGQNKTISMCSQYYNCGSSKDNLGINCNCKSSGMQFEPSFSPMVYAKGQAGQWNAYRSGANLRLSDPYQREVDLTAQLLLKHGVYVNSLVSALIGQDVPNTNPFVNFPVSSWGANSYYFNKLNSRTLVADTNTVAFAQFGNPYAASQKADFSQFDASTTLTNLRRVGAGSSLQAQMLSQGGFMRVFDIINFSLDDGTNKDAIINNFYANLVASTTSLSKTCVQVPDPVVFSSALPPTSTSAPADDSSDGPINEDGPVDITSSSSVVASSSSSVRYSSSVIQASSSLVASSSSSRAIETTSSSALPSSSSSSVASSSSVVLIETRTSSSLAESSTLIASSSFSSSAVETSSSFALPSSSSGSVASSSSVAFVETVSASSSAAVSSSALAVETTIPVVETSASSVAETTTLGPDAPSSSSSSEATSSVAPSSSAVETTSFATEARSSITDAASSTTAPEIAQSSSVSSSDAVSPTESTSVSTSVDDGAVSSAVAIDDQTPSTVVTSASPSPTDETDYSEEYIDLNDANASFGDSNNGNVLDGSYGRNDNPAQNVVQANATNSVDNENVFIGDPDHYVPPARASSTASAASVTSTSAVVFAQETIAASTIVIQEKSQAAQTQTVATYTVLAPMAVGATLIGLFIIRRNKSIVQDFRYAFGENASAGGENPLYQSLVHTHDNPLFANGGVDGVTKDNIEDVFAAADNV